MHCRDFFLYTALKEGAKLNRPEGLRDQPPHPWTHSPEAFQRWAGGRTGFPFVDACMRELAATGYMSNRGRQNVSSFLCKVRCQHIPAALHVYDRSLKGPHASKWKIKPAVFAMSKGFLAKGCTQFSRSAAHRLQTLCTGNAAQVVGGSSSV